MNFDYIFVDEAGYVRTHSGSTIIQPRILSVMSKLSDLINGADKVVLMQYYLLEDDISFYTDLAGAPAGDRRYVTRKMNSRPPVLYPTRWSTNKVR